MSGAYSAIVVEGHDETSDASLDLDRWCEVARSTLADEGVGAGRLDLIFVAPEVMAQLNEQHMGHEGPTDVLSFPLDGPEAIMAAANDVALVGPESHLGDVVVCPQVAEAQAGAHAGTVEAELTLLVVHGVLHVLGHDHAQPDETALMRGRERVHLARYALEHPEAA